VKIIFSPKYCYWTVLLLAIEIFIGTFIRDSFVRPFIGDVLVVILLYCLLKTFWKVRVPVAAWGVLVFACAIEVLQYFKLVNLLGLQQHKLLVIMIGATFDWQDILAYIIGTAAILWLDKELP
jgi:DNA integrity scanning protein DisA with diadenylate cyclase activity